MIARQTTTTDTLLKLKLPLNIKKSVATPKALSRAEVATVLNSAYKPLINLVLELVNLKDKERVAIELVDLRGMTEERAAEEMQVSRNSIQNYRRKAYQKMAKAWQDNKTILKILEGV